MSLFPCLWLLLLILSVGTTFGSVSEASKAVEQLKSKNKVERRQGAEHLASLKDPQLLGALAGAMEDTDAYVRIVAARGLAMLKSEPAASLLIKTLGSDKSPEVRQTAALGLRMRQTPAVFDALTQGLKDGAEPVRIAAVSSLVAFKDAQTATALTQAASDPSANVRRRIAAALGELKREEGHAALKALATDSDGTVQAAALQALTLFN